MRCSGFTTSSTDIPDPNHADGSYANLVSNNSGGISPNWNRTKFAYDPATGRQTATVRRETASAAAGDCAADAAADLTPADEDVVVERSYDALGNLWQETTRFGDVAEPSFTTEYTYAYGVVQSDHNTALSYFNRYNTIDPATGLVLQEEANVPWPGHPDGVTRTVAYDELRRPVKEQIGAQVPWEIEYHTYDDGGIARLDYIKTFRGTSGANDYTESTEHYDAAGRVTKRSRLHPDGSLRYQHTRFDSRSGKPTFSTEWTTSATWSSSLDGTTTDYTTDGDGLTTTGLEDLFGRPIEVKGSLGEVTRYEYDATIKRVTVEDVSVASGASAYDTTDTRADVTTEYYEDGLGRLRIVKKPTATGSGHAASPAAEAVYEFDVLDRLVEVHLVDEATLAPTAEDRFQASYNNPQTRSFSYDKLGRQESATHPENGTTTTLAWNALGAATKVQDAMGTARGHHHETTYDAAGRPIRTERVATTGSTFDHAVASGDWMLNSGWSFETSGCLGAGLYHGDPVTCRYAQGVQQVAVLKLKANASIGPVPPGAILTFQYFREVRDRVGTSDGVDQLIVEVGDLDQQPTAWTEVYRLDATQVSWSATQQSPAISLAAYAGKTISLRITFDSADDKNTSLARGVVIYDVRVRRPDRVTLQEIVYDQSHGVAGNKPRSRPTEVIVYDEATGQPTYTKRLIYAQSEGMLSAEELELDWNRTGQFDEFESGYGYDTFGQLDQRTPPHPVGDPSPQVYQPAYAHGSLVSLKRVYGGDDYYVIKDPAGPGVEYNHAGGVSRIRFGNGVDSVITPNVAFLPQEISLVGVTWTTGSYSYDGARNIVGIGSDVYRYDPAGRLRRALVTSNDFGSGLVLDYDFDIYGNMLGRTAMLPDGKAPGVVRAGLPIVGQSFAGNRIATSGFSYDENGNLIKEPEHDDVGGFQYSFVPENRMAYVQPLDGDGRFVQEAAYDGSGNRWLLRTWADGGKPLITLRDVTGAVAVEYRAESATSGLEPRKAYAHGAGQLLATTSTCGPAPALSFTDRVLDGADYYLELAKKDYVTPTGAYRIVVTNASGQTKESTFTVAGDVVRIEDIASNLFQGEHNWIAIESTLDCGATGLGNAVSYIDTAYFSCITRTSVSNKSFTDDTASLDLWGDGDGCPGGWKYRAWLYPEGGGTPVMLADNLPQPYLKMPGTPLGAGHGTYAIVEFDPATGNGPLAVGMAINDERNSRGESGEAVGTAAWRRTEYIHVDHLGSTRVVTDEAGAIAAKYKYYPFGLEADTSSGSDVRMKFTGHERDEGIGLDYMRARYHSSSVSRFWSVDTSPASMKKRVLSTWNRYAYVRNNPINRLDPDGLKDTIYVRFDPDYGNQGPGEPSHRSIAGGIAQANQKFENAGSSVRVKLIAGPDDEELDSSDRVATIRPGRSKEAEESGERVPGVTYSDGSISLFPQDMFSDNLDTPTDEAAGSLGNVLAHEGGHSYGVTYAEGEAYVAPNGEVDSGHSGDPSSVMAPATGSKPKEFDDTAGSQLPKEGQ